MEMNLTGFLMQLLQMKPIFSGNLTSSKFFQMKSCLTYSVRNVPANYMNKYFFNSNQSYTLSDSAKKTVKFMKINLIDDKNIRMLRNVDVIFCRNVLIYFDVKSKQKVTSNLYDCL